VRRRRARKAVTYSAGEIGRVRVVEDFLPPPEALVLREDTVKVTLALSRRSVDFFKRAAKSRRVPISASRAAHPISARSGRLWMPMRRGRRETDDALLPSDYSS